MKVFACSLVIIALLAPAALAGEETIKKDAVPEAVLKAFEQAYPFVKVTEYEKEDRNGVIYYEIEGKVGKLKLEMVYTPEGALYEIEQTIKLKKVPKAVIQSAKKAHPKAKIKKAELLTRGAETLYEIYLKKGKEKIEIVLDPTGKILEPQEKEDEDKKEGE
jgi:uncharacterized membrane protein YkoI